MTAFHDELVRRLKRLRNLPNEDARVQGLADIRGWFLDISIEHGFDFKDLSREAVRGGHGAKLRSLAAITAAAELKREPRGRYGAPTRPKSMLKCNRGGCRCKAGRSTRQGG
jgi:hypothetical protein